MWEGSWAAGLLSLGHEVKIGSRDPQKLEEWASAAAPRGSAAHSRMQRDSAM